MGNLWNQGMKFKYSTCPPGQPEKAASATSSSFSPCAPTCFLDILPLIDDTWTLWSDCGHLATKEFRTLRITFWCLCIPLFYMIFLTIIYNWMCSWLLLFYKSAVHSFSMNLTTNFIFVLGEGMWCKGKGGLVGRVLFIVFTNFILSCFFSIFFEFKSPSSSYTVYYQFWYKLYIYINI